MKIVSFSGLKFYDDTSKRDMESMKTNPEKKAIIEHGLKRLDEISGKDTVVLKTHSHDKDGFNITLRNEAGDSLFGFGYLGKSYKSRIFQKEFADMCDYLYMTLPDYRKGEKVNVFNHFIM